MQIAHGGSDPNIERMPRLHQILRGIKAERGKQGNPSCSRLPITPGILRKLKRVWVGSDTSFRSIMLWAAFLTTFFSFCHSGEITVETEGQYDPNTHSNVATDNPSDPTVLSLNIKLSKTDQGRVGCQVILGKTNDDLCPVTALLQYLSRWGCLPGPLFHWQDGTPLSKAKFVEAVRQGLAAANLPAQHYAGHSFRIGAATTAAMMGLQDSAIQMLSHWKSDIIRSSPRHLACLSSYLSRSTI